MSMFGTLLSIASPIRCALLFLLLAAASILGALGFQHIGGYQPCALCLMQRTPYYIGMPLAALTLAALAFRAPRGLVLVLFAGLALLALYNAGLGAYHSGIEWDFWKGPESCAPSGDPLGGDLGENILEKLKSEVAPSCTEAVWRFLGLSFAGWNVLVSLFLAALALAGLNGMRETADQTAA